MSTYDANLDELENLLRDLDGRPASVAPARGGGGGKAASMNFNELDDIINVLGDKPTPKTGTTVHVQARQPQQQQQQHYQPQQNQHQQNGHGSYLNSANNSNRNTMDNIDDLLRGLESNRSSVAVPAQKPVQIQHQQHQNQYQNPNQYQNQNQNQNQYQPQPQQQHQQQQPTYVQKRMTHQAPLNPASQKVFVAKPPSVRPVDGDDLDLLIGNLTKDQNVGNSALSSKGMCAGCGKNIVGESISALGSVYHPAHFACGNCRQPIGTGSFFEQDGVPHCERCYQELLCSRCAHCDQPILDKCVTALGKKWHMSHFICTQCLSPFGNGRYFEKDSRPYCESCFSGNFAPRCGGCNQPIKGECTNALGQAWHPEHFVCQYCQKAFNGSFFEFAGKPYCDVHYHQQTGSLCAGCSKAITGKCVNALDKKWHPEHFICAFCMNPLVGGNFTENQNKAYCKDCHGKLFG